MAGSRAEAICCLALWRSHNYVTLVGGYSMVLSYLGFEMAKIHGSFTSPKNASKWQLGVMGGGYPRVYLDVGDRDRRCREFDEIFSRQASAGPRLRQRRV
jgi:hypothetical protein